MTNQLNMLLLKFGSVQNSLFSGYYFQAHLSVGDDGTYLENVHWQQNIYIGRGSNGCCYQCMDLETQKLFAVKRVRESLDVEYIIMCDQFSEGSV